MTATYDADTLRRFFTLTPDDLALVRTARGDHNRHHYADARGKAGDWAGTSTTTTDFTGEPGVLGVRFVVVVSASNAPFWTSPYTT